MNIKSLIFVGGVGRSGTSILSKLLASSKATEFFYEPVVLMHLLEELDTLPTNYDWQSLLETILLKDLIKGALSGRTLNLNPNDISSVYNYKSDEEIKVRFLSSFRQVQLEAELKNTNAVIKVLDNIVHIQLLQQYLPDAKAVIIFRNPLDTIKSILQKGWFSNEQLKVESHEPLRKMAEYKGMRMHAFISIDFYDKWLEMNEVDRVAFYYQYYLGHYLNLVKQDSVNVLCYESLLANPSAATDILFSTLSLEYGVKTSEIIKSIHPIIHGKSWGVTISKLKRSSYYKQCEEVYDCLKSTLK